MTYFSSPFLPPPFFQDLRDKSSAEAAARQQAEQQLLALRHASTAEAAARLKAEEEHRNLMLLAQAEQAALQVCSHFFFLLIST